MTGGFFKWCLSVFLYLSFCHQGLVLSQNPQLYINEFQASNVSSVTNPLNGEYSDWIELYNAGTTNIEIGGYFLTDDPLEPQKWEVPFEKTLLPGEYIVFWADDIDEYVHTSFKLSRSGEFIGVYDHKGEVIDSLSFGYQEDDISYGRIPGDLQQWAYFDQVTPGMANAHHYFAGKTEDPAFSINGGFYKGSQPVSIFSTDPGIRIYYTLNGEVPDTTDRLYTEPLVMDSTTALRIRAFEKGKLPGNIITRTYFIEEQVNLPFISLTTEPKNLFDDSLGIYVIGTNGIPGYCTDTPMNVNRDWERPVNVELYDVNGNAELNQRAGLKIFGGCSRTRYSLKSLALYARGDYGKGSFDCQLFKDKPIYSFESFILRTSGDDVVHTMFRDAMGQTVVKETDIDRQAYRPAAVFINGQYWGIHNIREKINEHYVTGNYGVDPDEVNLIKGSRDEDHHAMHGSAGHYDDLIQYVKHQHLEEDRIYQHVTTRMDINNYIDYQIAEIYMSATDWPVNNIKYWRADSGPYDKWRWVIYDLDNCFFPYLIDRNTLDMATDPWCDCTWPNPPGSTLLFRRLLVNETFRNEFIQRYAWHMNTTFQPDRIKHIIDSMKALIEPEIPRHIERWGGQIVPDPEFWIRPFFNSMEEWEKNIEDMKYFVERRWEHARKHVMDYFNLTGDMVTISIISEDQQAGIIKVNSQRLPGKSHTGDYFPGIPIKIKAIASLGYEFNHWEQHTNQSGIRRTYDQTVEFTPDVDILLRAHFKRIDKFESPLMINEINYHPADDPDPGDWVEFYNTRNGIIDLTGWVFMDGNPDHVYSFPSGHEIGPGEFLVLCRDIAAFREVFPEVNNCTGNLGFGLSNGGEVIRLYGPQGELVDFVDYDDALPWPEEADGSGATLELISPELDNNLPESWEASHGNGTPGRQNFSNSIEISVLHQNYPNPFSSSTTISFTLANPGFVNLKITDTMGRVVATLAEGKKELTFYEINWDPGYLPSGIYFCTMMFNNEIIDTKKLIIIN